MLALEEDSHNRFEVRFRAELNLFKVVNHKALLNFVAVRIMHEDCINL